MTETERKLIRFASAVIDQSRNDGFPGDVDGGWLHDKMDSMGIIVPHPVTEPCDPENCPCAELDGIPGECYRLSTEVQLALAEAEQSHS